MITGPIKLGLGIGGGYVVGGSIGVAILQAVKPDASADTITGAKWAGRIAVSLVFLHLLGGGLTT